MGKLCYCLFGCALLFDNRWTRSSSPHDIQQCLAILWQTDKMMIIIMIVLEMVITRQASRMTTHTCRRRRRRHHHSYQRKYEYTSSHTLKLKCVCWCNLFRFSSSYHMNKCVWSIAIAMLPRIQYWHRTSCQPAGHQSWFSLLYHLFNGSELENEFLNAFLENICGYAGRPHFLCCVFVSLYASVQT